VFEHDGLVEQTPLPPEVVASFRGNKNKIPPVELKFKKNAPVILLRNLNLDEELANGTVLIFKYLTQRRRCAIVETLDGRQHFIPRIRFEIFTEHAHLKVRRRQFPLRLAFALTSRAAGSAPARLLSVRPPRTPSRSTSRDRFSMLKDLSKTKAFRKDKRFAPHSATGSSPASSSSTTRRSPRRDSCCPPW